MKLPKQALPVSRSAKGWIDYKKNEQPHTVVDIVHASNIADLRISLANGANHHAPMRFLTPVGSCGCHILSGSSMAVCLAACGML